MFTLPIGGVMIVIGFIAMLVSTSKTTPPNSSLHTDADRRR
jgi:hypothetical protein